MDVAVAWMRKKYPRKKMNMKDQREYLEDHCLKASRIALHPTKVERDRLFHQGNWELGRVSGPFPRSLVVNGTMPTRNNVKYKCSSNRLERYITSFVYRHSLSTIMAESSGTNIR
jgi:hypothetical protein